MRALERNKKVFYYAPYIGKREILIDDKKTGDWELIYGEPVKSKARITAAKGYADTRLFGEELNYQRTMAFDTPEFPIDEYSILWVDVEPNMVDGVITKANDYVVAAIARELNFSVIAIRKVDVSIEERIISPYLAMDVETGYLVYNTVTGTLVQLVKGG